MQSLDVYLSNNKSSIVVDSVDELFAEFGRLGRLNSQFSYYRGHTDATHKICSTIERFEDAKYRSKEKLLIRQFKKIACNYLTPQQIPANTFGWLTLMQHYGVPTRLMDVTTSPYVALYFAVNEWRKPLDAALWVFNPSSLHDACISRLYKSEFSLPLDRSYGFHQPDFVRENYFQEAFLSGKFKVAMILEPEVSEKRLFHQQGAFLVASSGEWSTEEVLVDILLDDSYMEPEKARITREQSVDWSIVKVIIPSELKKEIRRRLEDMNVHAATLFPDLAGAARYVKEYVDIQDLIGNRWTLKDL
jgi:hypothetical protein